MKKIIICITVLFLSGFIYAKGAFVEVGDPSFFPDDFTSLISMKIDKDGNIYAAYIQDDYYFSVAKFDGESWSDVGERKFSGGIGNISETPNVEPYVSFTLDKNGVPYVSFPASGTYTLNVMRYSSEDSKWKYVGKNNITDYKVFYTSVAVDPEGAPYAIFSGCNFEGCEGVNEDTLQEYSIGKVSVMKFNGTEWSYVDVPVFFDRSQSENNKILFDSKGVPYIAFSHGTSDVFVMKFNGTEWEMVGDTDAMNINTSGSFLIDREDNLYLNCFWSNDFSDPWIIEFNDEKWSKKFASQGLGSLNFTNSNIPYARFSDWIEESSSIKVSFGKYIDESWNIIDSFEFIHSNSVAIIMELDKNDIPFFAYVNNDQQVELVKYDPEAGETPDDADDDIVSDEETVSDEDSAPVNDKDSGSSGCGMVVM